MRVNSCSPALTLCTVSTDMIVCGICVAYTHIDSGRHSYQRLCLYYSCYFTVVSVVRKGKRYPVTRLWTCPQVQEVEVPKISRQSAHEGGKVVSLTHRPPLPSELQFLGQILIKLPDIKLHENASNGSRVDGQTDMAKLIVAFRMRTCQLRREVTEKMVAILTIKLQLDLHQVFVVS